MAEEDLLLKARTIVLNHINDYPIHAAEHMEDIDDAKLEEIHVLSVRSVLSRWRILIATTYDSVYLYQVIFDKRNKKTRLTIYKEFNNVIIKDPKE